MATEINSEFDEKRLIEAREAWSRAYVHVWSDLSKGVFDREAIEKAADEYWQRSPKSDPVLVAAVEFTKPGA